MPKGIGYPRSKKKKKKTNSDLNKGRIFEGPRGGQWTPRKRKEQ